MNLKSSFVSRSTHNLVPVSCIHTRTQNSMGQKGGGDSAWNIKGFSSLWSLDRPNSMYLPNPSELTRCDARSTFKRILTGLNLELSSSYIGYLTKTKEISLLFYLPVAEGIMIGFMPFARVLVQC